MPRWDLSSLSCFKNSRDSLSQDATMRILEVTESTSQSCSSVYDPLINRKREEGSKITEMKLSSYTLRSCGVAIARAHMYDWLVLVLLVVVKTILHFVHPFYWFVGKDMMIYLKYPLKSNTVPTWAVQVFSTLLPMAIFLIVYLCRRDFYDLHHATLGLLFSVLVTTVITDSIKDAVGRPRPDFFWRCFPDGKDVYDHLGNVICHGDKNVVREGYKSFPSGHTSWAFAGLGFLSLYLCGKIKAFDHHGHVAKLCIVFLPLFVACLVGISRVDDYWHHWQDVFAGACLGMTVATFCYLQFFPPPYHPQGCRPYAYFQALEDSQAGLHTNNAMNPISTEVMEAEEVDRDDASKALSGPHPANNSRSTTEDV